MDVENEIKNLKEAEKQTSPWSTWCCYLPLDASVATFCGLALVVIGLVWLFSTFGLLTAVFTLFWPLLFICLGLFWLLSAA